MLPDIRTIPTIHRSCSAKSQTIPALQCISEGTTASPFTHPPDAPLLRVHIEATVETKPLLTADPAGVDSAYNEAPTIQVHTPSLISQIM